MGKERLKKRFRERNREILSPSAKIVRWIFSIVLLLYTSITIFVIGITVMDSMKSKGDLVTNFVGLPKAWTLENYVKVLTEENLLRYAANSVFLVVVGTLGCLFLGALTAYGISRFEFRGKGFIVAYFLIGMMVPIQVSVLPLFLILRTIGLLNNLLGLALVYVSGISMGCFIFQKFFQTIPMAMEESARMDGAGDFKIFFRIKAIYKCLCRKRKSCRRCGRGSKHISHRTHSLL